MSEYLDVHGYPTDAALDKIAGWGITGHDSVKELLEFCANLWSYPDYWRTAEGVIDGREWIEIATGGWSGNESVVCALNKNKVFWALCWMRSERGGRYRFFTGPRGKR